MNLNDALVLALQKSAVDDLFKVPETLWAKNAAVYAPLFGLMANTPQAEFNDLYLSLLGKIDVKKEEFKKYHKTIKPTRGCPDLTEVKMRELKALISIMVRASSINCHKFLVAETQWWNETSAQFKTVEGVAVINQILRYNNSVKGVKK